MPTPDDEFNNDCDDGDFDDESYEPVGSCDQCGSAVEVLTKAPTGAYDGDEVRCTECEQTGQVSADEDGCDTVWHDPEQEERKIDDA